MYITYLMYIKEYTWVIGTYGLEYKMKIVKIKCDTCEIEMTSENDNRPVKLWDSSVFDLCGHCYKKLMDYLKENTKVTTR